jgi:hypothetical protein
MMITEIQLSNNRVHLLYLQRAIRESSRAAGICQRDCDDMGKAISQVCAVPFKSMGDAKEATVCVRIAVEHGLLTAEIEDRCTLHSPTRPGEFLGENGYSGGLESARRLVDSLEIIRGAEDTTIRLTKSSDRDSSFDFTMPTVPVAG